MYKILYSTDDVEMEQKEDSPLYWRNNSRTIRTHEIETLLSYKSQNCNTNKITQEQTEETNIVKSRK